MLLLIVEYSFYIYILKKIEQGLSPKYFHNKNPTAFLFRHFHQQWRLWVESVFL